MRWRWIPNRLERSPTAPAAPTDPAPRQGLAPISRSGGMDPSPPSTRSPHTHRARLIGGRGDPKGPASKGRAAGGPSHVVPGGAPRAGAGRVRATRHPMPSRRARPRAGEAGELIVEVEGPGQDRQADEGADDHGEEDVGADGEREVAAGMAIAVKTPAGRDLARSHESAPRFAGERRRRPSQVCTNTRDPTTPRAGTDARRRRPLGTRDRPRCRRRGRRSARGISASAVTGSPPRPPRWGSARRTPPASSGVRRPGGRGPSPGAVGAVRPAGGAPAPV